MDETLVWLKLGNQIFSFDKYPEKVDALFCHGWSDLKDDEIAHIAKCYERFQPSAIVLNGLDNYTVGDVGLAYWKEQLVSKYNIPESVIRSVPPAVNTASEAKSFMDFALVESIKSALIISVPMHILRAFLTNIGVTKQINHKMSLYPSTFKDIDWQGKIKVQGYYSLDANVETSRLGRLIGECGRIVEYRKRYEAGEDFVIASVKEGLDYINNL